jgi:hypothetical protein
MHGTSVNRGPTGKNPQQLQKRQAKVAAIWFTKITHVIWLGINCELPEDGTVHYHPRYFVCPLARCGR